MRQLADRTGQVVQSYSFSPFGVPLGESDGEPYGYTGEQWDASTGLVYLRARYYQPETGRFTQRDLWPGNHQQPLTLNPYLYVLANPVSFADPTGQIPDGFFVGSGINVTAGWMGLNLVRVLAPCSLERSETFNVIGVSTETAYDFVHREKQDFTVAFYGNDFLQVWGVEASVHYEGLTTGFKDVENVEDYGGMSIETAPILGFELPTGFELPLAPAISLAVIELGVATSFGHDVNRPGVDTWAIGVNVETLGIGVPGLGLEEGTKGSYLAVSVANPVGESEPIRDLATLESEIRRASWVIGDIAIAAARYWWNITE